MVREMKAYPHKHKFYFLLHDSADQEEIAIKIRAKYRNDCKERVRVKTASKDSFIISKSRYKMSSYCSTIQRFIYSLPIKTFSRNRYGKFKIIRLLNLYER